jgi:hypothetical protein
MMTFRIRAIALLTAFTALASSCERISVGPEIAGELRRGRAYAEAIAEQPRADTTTPIDAATAVALGYLERHRLGLGSPFRLIDYALRDGRLPDSSRATLAWALLARTLDGDGYRIDPLALDSLDTPSPFAGTSAGSDHLRLIDGAVRDARDPRAGELAVRLAYTIAAAEHRLRSGAPLIAAYAAALVSDRERAREDARELLRVARSRGEDPLAMVSPWRAERRFRVERPPMERLSAAGELEAMELTPRLLRELGDLAERQASDDGPRAVEMEHSPFLDRAAAVRLAEVERLTNAPPMAPVVVSLAKYRGRVAGAAGLSPLERAARERFVTRARGEEGLVAERGIIAESAPGISVARATLAAAVALRAYSQERPWLPGDGGPTTRELTDRFGLAAITFDPDVPEWWKPYYRSMLAASVRDIRRVIPALDLAGLRIHFGESPMRGAALALHEPRQRTIYLPLATGAGTIAHELAHDIDWQTARARYAVRGAYATDRVLGDERGGRLAASLRGLAAASKGGAAYGDAAQPLSARPTEVFARGLDWFVAVSLAREERTNGYLSSVQDDLLTGYVTVTPPDVTGGAGSALVSILDDVAPAAPVVREWFLTRYGAGRALTPYDLVRRVLEAPLDSAAADTPATLTQLVAPVIDARAAALALIDAGSCRPGSGGHEDERMARARRRLVDLTARARASGLMRDRGTVLAAQDAWRWAALAPYAGSQPLLLGGPLHPTFVEEMAQGARALDVLDTPDDESSIVGQGCVGTGS